MPSIFLLGSGRSFCITLDGLFVKILPCFNLLMLDQYSACMFQINFLTCFLPVVCVTPRATYGPQYRVNDLCGASSSTFSFPFIPEPI